MSRLIDVLGDRETLALGGLAIGLLFGAFAQRSRFCLRAAIIEFSHGIFGGRLAIWVLTFAAAVAATQAAISWGILDVSEARQIANRGSLSGAIIGGLMFGTGMILARGCASRLLVLSATGNLRALCSGLILTIVAQASLRGALSPLREQLASLWTVEGGAARDLLARFDAGPATGLALGLLWLSIGAFLAYRNRVKGGDAIAAAGIGVVVAGGWLFTYIMTQQSFTPTRITSVSFTGPSADTLMALISSPTLPLGFDVGLVPGVFLGSLIAALVAGEFKLQGFEGGASMLRYISGASLMGFGGMLAGGCAVGAGVTGGAIFALTSWVALSAMWLAAGLTDYVLNRPAADCRAAVAAPAQ